MLPPRPTRPRAAAKSRAAEPVADSQETTGVLGVVRKYKSALVVAGVVFLVLSYLAPKLAAWPQLLTPAGRFNSLGILAIAGACSGAFVVADKLPTLAS